MIKIVKLLTLRNFAVSALFALAVVGCAKKDEQPAPSSKLFATPEAAVSALVTAFEKSDSAEVVSIFGKGADNLLSSGDATQDQADKADFLAAYHVKHSIVDDGDNKKVLVIGPNDWPFPVPLVNYKGQWFLDGAAGTQELVFRRIGRNELGAISVCRGFVNAQNEYASQGHDGDEPGVYALKLISDEGQHNGLYWPTAEGETPSPVGPAVAEAAADGYKNAAGAPYHGYHYRLLYKQGSNAKGGAKEYFDNGVLTGGFALIAWPAQYQVSGVKSFVVNQDGMVYQKDLGEASDAEAAKINSFNPDATWELVPADTATE